MFSPERGLIQIEKVILSLALSESYHAPSILYHCYLTEQQTQPPQQPPPSGDEVDMVQNNKHNPHNNHHNAVLKHHVLLEMPNCTLKRAYYSGHESVRNCVERVLVNTGSWAFVGRVI